MGNWDGIRRGVSDGFSCPSHPLGGSAIMPARLLGPTGKWSTSSDNFGFLLLPPISICFFFEGSTVYTRLVEIQKVPKKIASKN